MELVYNYIPAIVSGILTLIVSLIGKRINELLAMQQQRKEEIQKEDEAIKNGMLGILRFRLRFLFFQFKQVEYITAEELDMFETLYHSYKGLNGNGIIDYYYQQILKLPIEKNTEMSNHNHNSYQYINEE